MDKLTLICITIAVLWIIGDIIYTRIKRKKEESQKEGASKVSNIEKPFVDITEEVKDDAPEEKDVYSMHDIWKYIKEHKKENDVMGVDGAATHPAYPGNVFTRIWVERVGEHCGRFAAWELTDNVNHKVFYFMDCDTETVSRRMLFSSIDNIYKEMARFFEETAE